MLLGELSKLAHHIAGCFDGGHHLLALSLLLDKDVAGRGRHSGGSADERCTKPLCQPRQPCVQLAARQTSTHTWTASLFVCVVPPGNPRACDVTSLGAFDFPAAKLQLVSCSVSLLRLVSPWVA